ncbi:hypothetical protein HanRHA438_Chr08g0351831 [Helianthus annuus]|nr:putative transmembrane emp24 domain-containing protein [Helianthus annuus]KAJ0553634.1 putative transmembrane emp24 domain-containing protein [Helianthus annuus]KAJ0897996.1 hypothetical protein HanRHA438_Chr08g0351831 [Helianthus annuus]
MGVVLGIRFVIDREECFSHKAEYGSTVRYSFVVIKVEGAWHYNEDGVDLVILFKKVNKYVFFNFVWKSTL